MSRFEHVFWESNFSYLLFLVELLAEEGEVIFNNSACDKFIHFLLFGNFFFKIFDYTECLIDILNNRI